MSKQHLRDFFDATVKKDDEAAKSAINAHIEEKAKEIIKLKEEAAKSPVKLKGNDLYVNDKKVGVVDHDPKDPKKGIKFTNTDGKATEYGDIPTLFKEVGAEHLKEAGGQLYALYTGTKGSGKLHLQFSGSKKECQEELADLKNGSTWESGKSTSRIVAANDDTPNTITESKKDAEESEDKLKDAGNKEHLQKRKEKPAVQQGKNTKAKDNKVDEEGKKKKQS